MRRLRLTPFTEVVSALLVLLVFRYIILEKDGSPWLWALMLAVRSWLFYTMWGTVVTTPHARSAGLRSAPRVLVVGLIALQAGISAYAWSHPKNFWNDADGVAAVCSRGGATFCSVLPSFVTASDRAGQAP